MSTLKLTPVAEIDTIHADLHKGFRSGKTKSIAFRKQQLLQLIYMIKDNESRFSQAFEADLGRSSIESELLEISVCLSEVTTAYNNVEKWSSPTSAPWSSQWFLSCPTIQKVPKGVVMIISPFNYPAFLLFSPIAGAIAAGNAVVVKMSELLPSFCSLIVELFAKYLDPQLYRVVNGAVPETTHLLSLSWDHIFYTGSGRVGRIVAAAAAKNLTPVTLELGGKCPVFIDPKCNLKSATRRLLWGKFSNAGQTCVAPDYVLVPKEGVKALVAELETAYAEFYPDGPSQSKSFARIVNSNHVERIKGLLDHTKGHIVVGGEIDALKKYVAPTIVKDVQISDSLMSDELFAPILPIIAVDNVDEALDIINSRDRPLALYAFTQDAKLKKHIMNNTNSGGIVFNDCLLQVAVPGLPFGGTGASGYGFHTGKYSFDTFTHLRPTLDNPAWLDIIMKMRFPPLTEGKRKMIRTTLFPGLPSRRSVRTRWERWFFVSLATVLAAYLTRTKALSRAA